MGCLLLSSGLWPCVSAGALGGSVLGSRVILAVVGGGAAATAAASAVRAGSARAELSRVATAELRLHKLIDLSVFLLALGFRAVGFVGSAVPLGDSSVRECSGCCFLSLVVLDTLFYFGDGVLEPVRFDAEGQRVNLVCGVVRAGVDPKAMLAVVLFSE